MREHTFDPNAWIDNLLEVNRYSAFTEEQKKIIDKHLRLLQERLVVEKQV